MPIITSRGEATRIVCRFSCGAASAVATKLILSECDRADVVIVNAFIVEEHDDNRRFLADCEKWFNHPIVVLRDEKYGASTHQMWKQKQYIIGHRNVPCSSELKGKLLDAFVTPDDVHVLGYTAEEEDRFDHFQDVFPNRNCRAPLIEQHLTKGDCLSIVERVGIVLPMMYRKGYDNANCIGCPKGGQNYWQAIREDFPERFGEVQRIQEDIGPGAYFLRYRSGPRKNERMPLSELPEGRGSMATEPSFTCSFYCDNVARSLKTIAEIGD